jgi:Methyltransferase domain
MNRPPDFNRLAGIYWWMELLTFGPYLRRCRCAFLADLAACRHALILGDGDGRFTARLLAANPALMVDAVDSSAAMLRALIRRAGPYASRLRTHLADARNWQPGEEVTPGESAPYDLIVTHFFLDCLTTQEVRSLANRLRPVVSPSASWLVSEFAVPPGWFGRIVARPAISALYMAFGRLTGLTVRTLPDHASALLQFGFTLEKRRTWLGGLLISQLWTAIPNPTSALLSRVSHSSDRL